MENLDSDNLTAGPKIFWIIRFKDREINTIHRKPAIDFIIPSLGNQQEWVQAFDQSFDQSSVEALESLGRIQKICENIKSDCQQAIKDPADYIDQTKKVNDKLSNLNEMIKQFNEIMRRLKNPLPPEEEQDPE